MRISDWSSDVCSSDLPLAAATAVGQADYGRVLERHTGLPFIHEGERTPATDVACLEAVDAEASGAQLTVGLAVQVAAAGDSLPEGREPGLPGPDGDIGGRAVLGEDEGTGGLERSEESRVGNEWDST